MPETNAEALAQEVIARYGVERPQDIELDSLCWGERLLSFEGQIEAADAWLVMRGSMGLARIRESIPYAGQKRFALAHELGHWLMHRQNEGRFTDSASTLSDYQRDPREVEANAFASELLVPDAMLRALHPQPEAELSYGLGIATTFTVGPFVAIRKLLRLPGVKALMVVSDGETMHYHRRSDACNLYSPARRHPIPPGPTREAAAAPGQIFTAEVDAHEWSPRAHQRAPWREQALRPDADSPVITLLTWRR